MIYFLVGAPDVAVTEGAIGVAFVTFIYVLALSDQGKLHVVTEEIPPFFYQDKGRIQGIEYEILQQLADQLSLDLEVEFVKHSDLPSQISSRRTEIIAGAFYKEYLPASGLNITLPFHQASLAKIVDTQIENAPIGTLTDLDVTDIKEIDAERISRFNALEDLMSAYNKEKISGFISDSARMSIALNQITTQKRKTSEISQVSDINYTFAIPSSEVELTDKLNELLENLTKTGQLEKILDRYLR